MGVDLEEVKRLRNKTGAGIGDCKKALEECDGSFAEAEKLLKKQGLASAAKRSERTTSEGKIFTGIDKRRLVMVEVLCETDFVAMTEQFQQLGQELVNQVLAEGATQYSEAQLTRVQQASAVLKENLVLGSLTQLLWDQHDVCSCYSHNQGKIVVAVRISCANDIAAHRPQVEHLCHDLALHAAAMAPQFLSRERVGQQFLAEQEEIFTALAAKEGISAAIRPNYIQGKLNKLLGELCFSEQHFVKNDKQKIKDVVAQVAKEVGAALTLADFRYVRIGQASQEVK